MSEGTLSGLQSFSTNISAPFRCKSLTNACRPAHAAHTHFCISLQVTSDQDEWFTPLLKPYKHYIPVKYNINSSGNTHSVDLIEQVITGLSSTQAVGFVEASKH